MKIKKGFMLRCVADRHIVVPVGKASVEFNGLITLNETGAFLWNLLADGCSYEDLVSGILSNFEDVDETTAKSGIDAFLESARGAGILEED